MQLFWERLSEEMCTRDNPGRVEYDQYAVPDNVAVESSIDAFN